MASSLLYSPIESGDLRAALGPDPKLWAINARSRTLDDHATQLRIIALYSSGQGVWLGSIGTWRGDALAKEGQIPTPGRRVNSPHWRHLVSQWHRRQSTHTRDGCTWARYTKIGLWACRLFGDRHRQECESLRVKFITSRLFQSPDDFRNRQRSYFRLSRADPAVARQAVLPMAVDRFVCCHDPCHLQDLSG